MYKLQKDDTNVGVLNVCFNILLDMYLLYFIICIYV